MEDESLDRTPLPFELNEEDHALIKAELAPGEWLLWAARGRSRSLPFRGPYLTAAIVGAVLFAFGYLGTTRIDPVLSVFNQMMLVLSGFSLIIGIFTLLIDFGAWIPQVVNMATLNRRLYALTNRRAIAWTPQSPPGAVKVESMYRGSTFAFERVMIPNGTDDVQLKYDMMFYGIENGAEVERLAHEITFDSRIGSMDALRESLDSFRKSLESEEKKENYVEE